MIPKTFEQWQRCITIDCGIELNAAYVAQRIKVLGDSHHQETQKFILHYGQAHAQQILNWFKQVQKGLL